MLLRQKQIDENLRQIKERIKYFSDADIKRQIVASSERRSTFYGDFRGILIAVASNAFVVSIYHILWTQVPYTDPRNIMWDIIGVISIFYILLIIRDYRMRCKEQEGIIKEFIQEAKNRCIPP